MRSPRSLASTLRRICLLGTLVGVSAVPGNTSARVDPLHLISQQIQKPNVLLILDTSSSMGQVPGQADLDWAEAGVDCDNGDRFCRQIGHPGRCFYTSSGRMGQGVLEDNLPCTTDAQCNVAYCTGGGGFYQPAGCSSDSDANNISSGATCKGICSHNSSISCTKDSNCGAGNVCRGMTHQGTNPGEGWPTACTVGGSECPTANPCSAYQIAGRNFCVPAGTATVTIKMCRLQQSMCRTDADCTQTGDSCGPASSRLVIAKRALDRLVSNFHQMVNFGFMTFRNTDYYPYYEVPSTSAQTVTTVLSREQLEAQGCFTTSAGPSATCTIHGLVHTRQAALPNSRYRINRGTSWTYHDATWGAPATCTLECALAGVGTGIYQGTYYTFTTYTGTPAGGGSWEGDSSALLRFGDYTGKVRNSGGRTYLYLETPSNRRNKSGVMANKADDPISGGTGSTCTWGAGGWWESGRWPFMDTSFSLPTANATSMMNAISRQLRKAHQGGIYPSSGTPTACTLKNGGAGGSPAAEAPAYSAYHYLQRVKNENTANGVSCRPNYVLFVTDGYPGGDAGCDSADCKLTPVGPGCASCRSIAAARSLRNDLGVKTIVVGFSNAVTTGAGRDFLDNLAFVGGTGQANYANNEDELRRAVDNAIYAALAGSYATSPITAGGTQAASNGGQVATMIFDSRADFPTWKGHLIAYDISGASPALMWDAAARFDDTAYPGFWKQRNVWTSKAKVMIKVQVDAAGNITNSAELADVGFGATAEEAALVARWMLGDPTLKNPAVLGAIVNSSATEFGGNGQPSITFVGASDGMLHAFHSRDQRIGAVDYYGGSEAFAYIPEDMAPMIRRLYAQGGQQPAPKNHVFGLANSPKLKRLCIADCANPGHETWKTVLAMPEGYGGSNLFVLDVTSAIGTNGPRSAVGDPPVQLLWHTKHAVDPTSAGIYAASLGKTISLPGFYFGKSTNLADYRTIFASGYTDLTNSKQGMVLISANATTGTVARDDDMRTLSGSCPKSRTEPTEPTIMADVAIARRYNETSLERIAAAYAVDTWGNMMRFVPQADSNGNIQSGASLSTVDGLSCSNPLHLAPTIVQLDRYDPTKSPGHIYIAQLTNSPFDPLTSPVSAGFPASQLIVRRDLAQQGSDIAPDSGWVVTPDESWGDNRDRVALSTTNSGQICAIYNTVTRTCTTAMPSSARPLSSATGILRADYASFALITLWYVPDAVGCTIGKTYLTAHEVSTTGQVSQRHGELIGNEPVMGAVFVGGKLVVARSDGAQVVTTPLLGTPTAAVPPGTVNGYLLDRYRGVGWIEVP